jgi:hypothetical protein
MLNLVTKYFTIYDVQSRLSFINGPSVGFWELDTSYLPVPYDYTACDDILLAFFLFFLAEYFLVFVG